MNKILSYSLLGVGGLIIAYPFLKKNKKVLSTEELLLSKNSPNYCDNLKVKKGILLSEFNELGDKIKEVNARIISKSIKDPKDLALVDELSKKRFEIDSQRIYIDDELKKNCEKEKVNCLSIDLSESELMSYIKELRDDLLRPLSKRKNCFENEDKTKTCYSDNTLKTLIEKANKELLNLRNKSTENDCRTSIENTRLEQSAYMLTEKSETQEKNVLKSNYTEQYIYIGIGSVVILTSLYLISKK